MLFLCRGSEYMDLSLIIIISILVILLLISLYLYLNYKHLKELQNKIDATFMTLDNNFKERWILIPNLISILKRYMKNDTTLESIIKLRNVLYNKKTIAEKLEINKNLETILPKIINSTNLYPELKFNKNFIEISNKLNGIEQSIKTTLNRYYEYIETYNTKLTRFPYKLIAKISKLNQIKIQNLNKELK